MSRTIETKTVTREEFYKAYKSHLGDKSTKINFRNGYEIHYPNGDVYKYVETLKPDRTPSSWSGTYMASDFTYACYWNGMLIVK